TPSIASPSRRIVSTCSGQGSISVTSKPLCERLPPVYPPIAPAPNTTIFFCSAIAEFLPDLRGHHKRGGRQESNADSAGDSMLPGVSRMASVGQGPPRRRPSSALRSARLEAFGLVDFGRFGRLEKGNQRFPCRDLIRPVRRRAIVDRFVVLFRDRLGGSAGDLADLAKLGHGRFVGDDDVVIVDLLFDIGRAR